MSRRFLPFSRCFPPVVNNNNNNNNNSSSNKNKNNSSSSKNNNSSNKNKNKNTNKNKNKNTNENKNNNNVNATTSAESVASAKIIYLLERMERGVESKRERKSKSATRTGPHPLKSRWLNAGSILNCAYASSPSRV